MCDCTEYEPEELEAGEEAKTPEKVAVPLRVLKAKKQ